MEVFEEEDIVEDQIEITEKGDLNGYVEDDDENFLVIESELGSKSESTSSRL